MKKIATNGMPECRQAGSISRILLLPCEQQGTIRLRYQLAEGGCKESQVALAKSLLTSPIKTVEELNFNAHSAVYWLLQAANKGQEEAVILLKDCVNAGIGISARNSIEVEKCLKFSESDIISRKVASSIFCAIMNDTEDILSEESFREKIESILREESDEYLLSDISEKNSPQPEQFAPKQVDEVTQSQPHVSFSEVVNSVQTCLEGNVPMVSLKQVTEYGEYKNWMITKYFMLVFSHISGATEELIQSFASLSILFSVLFLCILLGVSFSFTTPGTETSIFIYNCNLFFVTLLCLLAMLSNSCFIICISFGVENMKKWLHLITFFEPNIKSKEIEQKYLMKTLYPLFTFFVVSFIYMILMPLNSTKSSFTDLGVLSFILMILVDRTISHQRYYANVSFILNALTCLYKSNILQKLSITILSLLNYDIVYEIGSSYEVHLNFISCLALPLVLPYLYLKMALGNERKGWHLVLLPHLMCVSWMNLACIHLADVDTTNIFFSLCTWLCIMILSRYLGLVLTVTLYIFVKAIFMSGAINFQSIFIIPIFGILYYLSLFLVQKFKISNNKLYCFIICILVTILSYQAANPQSVNIDGSASVLPWDKYQTHCHHHAWYRTNPAEVQISCLPFKGRKIQIDGTVSAIEVVQIQNSLQTVANILPNPFHDWFVCALGKRYVTCDTENISAFEKEHCILYETLNLSHCHLHNWDEYKYQITMEVSTRTSPEIVLFVDHVCTTFIRNLKEGDSLQVVGMLKSNIGGLLPKLQLIKAECSSCYSSLKCNTSIVMPQPNYSLSLKNIVWFYFSPFIQYKIN